MSAPATAAGDSAQASSPSLRLSLRPFILAILLLPAGLLLAVFGVALVLLLTYTFRPYTSAVIQPVWTLATWHYFLTSSLYWSVIWQTVKLGLIVTAVTVVAGYPVAWVLARLRSRLLSTLAYLLLFFPLLTSVVVRSYGWLLLLGDRGFVNDLLVRLPWVKAPIPLTYNEFGVIVALIHILMPFAVFPMLSVIRQMPANVGDAASDLGANPVQTFLRVQLPLTLPGIISSAQLIFTLTVSAWVTASLLGGGRVLVLAILVFQNISNLNWPTGAVESFVLLIMSLIAVVVFSRIQRAVYRQRSDI